MRLQKPFEPFQRLGFCIWDREKMTRLGLIEVPASVKQSEPSWLAALS